MNILLNESDIDEKIINQIIRPSRQLYNDLDLGKLKFIITNPGPKVRTIQNQQIIRQDYEIKNNQSELLKMSIWFPQEQNIDMPIIVFSHGNSGSRLDSIQMMQNILSMNIALCSFDYSGCGNSQGDLITLGLKEKYDLNAIIQYLQLQLGFQKFILWGRSMGAVISLLYTAEFINTVQIIGLVLDSAFCSFIKLMEDFAAQMLGDTMTNIFFDGLKSEIIKKLMQKTGFNFADIQPQKSILSFDQIPVIFAYSFADKVVLPTHTQNLAKKYRGPKDIIIFQGEHNGIRDQKFLIKVLHKLQDFISPNKASRNILYNKYNQENNDHKRKISLNYQSMRLLPLPDTQNNLQTENFVPLQRQNTMYNCFTQTPNPVLQQIYTYQPLQPQQKGISLLAKQYQLGGQLKQTLAYQSSKDNQAICRQQTEVQNVQKYQFAPQQQGIGLFTQKQIQNQQINKYSYMNNRQSQRPRSQYYQQNLDFKNLF